MRASIACLAALVVIVACSKRDNYATDSAAGGVGATSTPAAAPLPAPPPSTTLTDANIVAKLAAADSHEVRVAKLVETRATSPAVKSFARLLVTDHSNHVKELAALEKKANLTPVTPASDNTRQDTEQEYQQFQSMPKGAAFDTAFVNHSVEDHQKVLTELQSLQPQNPDLKALIDKTVPTIQKHLDKGKELQTKLSGTK